MESLQGTKCSSIVRFGGFWRRICLHSNGMLCLICKTFKKLHWTPYRWFISSWLRKSPSSLRMSLTCIIPCYNHFCHRKGLFWMVIYRFSHITWFLITALYDILFQFGLIFSIVIHVKKITDRMMVRRTYFVVNEPINFWFGCKTWKTFCKMVTVLVSFTLSLWLKS